MEACQVPKLWQEAFVALFGAFCGGGVEPSVVTCNVALSRSLAPDAPSLGATLGALGGGASESAAGRWQLPLLQEARSRRIAPNVIIYSAAITALFELLEEMQLSRVTADTVVLNAVLSSCERGRQWQQALALLSSARLGLGPAQPNLVSFNACLSACEKCDQLARALELLREMEGGSGSSSGSRRAPAPDVISYSAVMSAAARAGEWQLALLQLAAMTGRSLAPDVVACNAAISACEKGLQWAWALHLLASMRSSKRPRP
ncbi:unnamed protein product, partial [Polarella glacialis]